MNITALVDVVFLLIVFFLTTSSLAEVTRVRLDLPVQAGEGAGRGGAATVVVNIASDGVYIVDRRARSLEGVLAMVRAESATTEGPLDVVVRADRGAPGSALNALATGLADAGIERWRLATEVPGPLGGGR